jgi:predicted DNA-binding transcriptional regulator YafY
METFNMTRPTSRVLALLEILQGGGTVRLADLAERLSVDERTARRYVAHLVDLDIPVESIRGRYGGYRLAPGYRMPPLMLTDHEAVAISLGLLAAGRAGVIPEAGAYESAAAKLRRVLPARLRDRLQALETSIAFTAPEQRATPLETETLLTLAEAVRDQRPVRISYTGRDGRPSDRIVHPTGVVAHAGHWYLAASGTGNKKRTFRMDRIGSTMILPGSFPAPVVNVAASDVLESLAQTPWTHQVSVRVRGTMDDVRARLPLGLALVEPVGTGSGWVVVRLRVERLDWVPALLSSLDLPFAVEEPDELRHLVHSYAERLHGYADAPGS